MANHDHATLAAHYRQLALDAYAAAQLLDDPAEKLLMHQIGLGYEHLAAKAAERRSLRPWRQRAHRVPDADRVQRLASC
jgi:hypothetical protein